MLFLYCVLYALRLIFILGVINEDNNNNNNNKEGGPLFAVFAAELDIGSQITLPLASVSR
jgi:hypothetical protein